MKIIFTCSPRSNTTQAELLYSANIIMLLYYTVYWPVSHCQHPWNQDTQCLTPIGSLILNSMYITKTQIQGRIWVDGWMQLLMPRTLSRNWSIDCAREWDSNRSSQGAIHMQKLIHPHFFWNLVCCTTHHDCIASKDWLCVLNTGRGLWTCQVSKKGL